MVWSSDGSSGTDTSSSSVQGQRYASNGAALGAQFQVNSHTTSQQSHPSVAMDSGGVFVVTWYSSESHGTDTSASSIQGQRFASNGSTQGAEFQVNTYTTSEQSGSSVASAPGASFVVAWHSQGSSETDASYQSIQAQRYRPPIVAPAMSSVMRFALGAALLALGVALARSYGSVSKRSRFSR